MLGKTWHLFIWKFYFLALLTNQKISAMTMTTNMTPTYTPPLKMPVMRSQLLKEVSSTSANAYTGIEIFLSINLLFKIFDIGATADKDFCFPTNANDQCLMYKFSQPFFAFEPPVNEKGDDGHQQQGGWVTEFPFEFGHQVEIHAVDTYDEGKRHKKHGKNRQDAHGLIGAMCGGGEGNV